jgi:phosphatidate cytidylyltransferase
MLKERLRTAVLLIPPLAAALILLPPSGLLLLFAAVLALAAWEWGALCGFNTGGNARLVYAFFITAGGTAAAAAGYAASSETALFALAVSAAFWLWLVVELMVWREGAGWLWRSVAGRAASGFGVLASALFALGYLVGHDPDHPALLLFVVVLVAIADTSAYFAGRAFGRTKLAPHISPGKTVEGALGGLAAVALAAYFGGNLVWRLEGERLAAWVGLAVACAFFSILGDLVESKFKRLAGVKDSGRLLPGHGGVLDRIDALTGAAPVFALGWVLFFQESR